MTNSILNQGVKVGSGFKDWPAPYEENRAKLGLVDKALMGVSDWPVIGGLATEALARRGVVMDNCTPDEWTGRMTPEETKAIAEFHKVMDQADAERAECREKYTREAVDPATGREYTVDVYPDGHGQKVNVRDDEAGTVIEPGMPETLGVTMDEGKRSVETEVTESLGFRSRDGEEMSWERPDPDPEHLAAARDADLLVAGDYERDPDFDRDDDDDLRR